MLIPATCPACAAVGAAPCEECRSQLRRAPSLSPPPGVDRCHALVDYDGVGRELIARLKYRNARASVPFLARGMASLVLTADVDLVTWAPTMAARRRRRGFDQAELLARRVARLLETPCRGMLFRLPGLAQTGRPVAERWVGGPAFSVRCHLQPGVRVLVVDDVVTTGATMAAAARALRRAGAEEVHALAAARTKPGRSGGAGVELGHGRVRVCG